jgi:hypothetical protein
MSREADIEAALSYFDADVKVQAAPELDGSRIVVEVNGQTHRFASSGSGRARPRWRWRRLRASLASLAL